MRMHLTSMLVAAAACVGCAAEPETETSGTIAIALTSSDPTGAVYRLPDGARLVMSGGTYYDEFSLDGDATFVRISVPPGDYGAELVHDTITGTQWPLSRTVGGVTEVVTATLVTGMPAPVTITEDGQTNLVLRFTVPDVGVVTFAEGDLDVTLDVDEVAASQLTFAFEGNLDVTSVVQDPAAPAVIATLPQLGQLGLYFSIWAHPTGPWTKSSQTSACAPAAWNSFSAATTPLHDVIFESIIPDGVLQICVYGGAGVPS
jgi:hypothetical protein